MIIGAHSVIYSKDPEADRVFHEFYLMCDDVDGFIADMKKRRVECGPVHLQPWGRLTQVSLPGGGKLGVYEPRHARPPSAR